MDGGLPTLKYDHMRAKRGIGRFTNLLITDVFHIPRTLHLLPPLPCTLLCLCSHHMMVYFVVSHMRASQKPYCLIIEGMFGFPLHFTGKKHGCFILTLQTRTTCFSLPHQLPPRPTSVPQPTRNPSPPHTTPNCLSMRNRGPDI